MVFTTKHKVYYCLHTLGTEGVFSAAKLFSCFFLGKDVKIALKGYTKSVKVRSGTSDGVVFFDTFIRKEYKCPQQDTIDLILDLGGNVGYSALFFTKEYPSATIVVLEPDIENYEALCDNVSGYPNIISMNKGVWWRKAVVTVKNPDAMSWGYQFEETDGDGVECVTIHDLITEHGGDKKVMVKMDIEGSEKDIFERDALWLRDIDVMQLEIHHCWKEVFTPLNELDYKANISGENIVVTFS